MMKVPAWLLVGAFVIAGCGKIEEQRVERAAERARQRAADGDDRGAIRFYEDAADGTAESAEFHYQMALIYDDRLKDPLSALYHFRRYLELDPSGQHAKDATAFAKEDELKVAAFLSNGALMTQKEAARLRNDNLELRKQLTELRVRIETLRKSQPVAGLAAEPVRRPLPPGTRTYVVQRGDTLAAISRKFYKTSARSRDIQDANFNTLGGTVIIKPGMELIIPE
jgi:nucleoid-associated protein YgaU